MPGSVSVYEHNDYKEYLNALAEQEPRGFKKSLASFANCQTAYVSHVLNGTAHFSWEQAEEISTGLGHTQEEKEYFLLCLEYTKAGTHSLKKFLKTRLDKLKQAQLSIKSRVNVKATLSREDQARYYSAWYYAAIHVMLTHRSFQTKEALTTYLRLSAQTVAEVLEFLISVGLAVKHGSRFEIGTSKIHLEKDSPLISKHHTNWRLQAIQSLEKNAEEDLHYSSVFTLTEADAERIRSLLVKEIAAAVAIIKTSGEEMTAAMVVDFFRV